MGGFILVGALLGVVVAIIGGYSFIEKCNKIYKEDLGE